MREKRLLSGLLVNVVNDDYMKRVFFVNHAFGYVDNDIFYNFMDGGYYPVIDISNGIKDYREGYYVGYLNPVNDIEEIDTIDPNILNIILPDSERCPVRLRNNK